MDIQEETSNIKAKLEDIACNLDLAEPFFMKMPCMDKRLRDFMKSFNGVGTKYLQNYLNWFLVLEKIKNNTKRMAMITEIALTSNKAWFEYKQQAFNMFFRI